MLRGSFDLLTALERYLTEDCTDFRGAASSGVPEGSIVFGDAADVIVMGAAVEPGVVFDVRHGAVVLEPGVEVRHGTRLEGPIFVGARSKILGGFIRASAFGPECRVHGEIAASVFLGYANKSHDGFVGPQRRGPLGQPRRPDHDLESQEHLRAGAARGRRAERSTPGGRISARSSGTTPRRRSGPCWRPGTVIGAGANVFGPPTPPKHVPPFAWGSAGDERLTAEGFLRIAERVLPRRGVELTAERRRSLELTFARGVAG